MCSRSGRARFGTGSRTTIAEMRALARKHGGRCLSDRYVVPPEKLDWKCSAGHRWQADAESVKRGTWCLHCSGRQTRDLEWARALAARRGGRLLAKEFRGAKQRYRWRCAKGHEWEIPASNVAAGAWCPRCAGVLVTLDDVQETARQRGGKCLSRRYLGADEKLLWSCAKGHVWKARPVAVRYGSWCGECARLALRRTLDEVREAAAKRGGRCLSSEYAPYPVKLAFQCAAGHRWEMHARRLFRGAWCARCSNPRLRAISFARQR